MTLYTNIFPFMSFLFMQFAELELFHYVHINHYDVKAIYQSFLNINSKEVIKIIKYMECINLNLKKIIINFNYYLSDKLILNFNTTRIKCKKLFNILHIFSK